MRGNMVSQAVDRPVIIRRLGGFLLLSIAGGLLIGVLTLLAQGALPDAVLQISNSGAVWVVIAFVLGWFAVSWPLAAGGGIVALLGEVIGYYTAAHYLIGADATWPVVLIWVLVAVVAGPLFGAAGYVARHGQGIRQKLGTAALGAVFIGEGLYYLLLLQHWNTAIAWLLIALLITVLLTWRATARLQIYLLTLGLGLVFFGGYLLLTQLDNLRAAIFTG